MQLPIAQRYIAGIIGMIIMGALAYTGSIEPETAFMGILGILAALGAFEAPSRKEMK